MTGFGSRNIRLGVLLEVTRAHSRCFCGTRWAQLCIRTPYRTAVSQADWILLLLLPFFSIGSDPLSSRLALTSSGCSAPISSLSAPIPSFLAIVRSCALATRTDSTRLRASAHQQRTRTPSVRCLPPAELSRALAWPGLQLSRLAACALLLLFSPSHSLSFSPSPSLALPLLCSACPQLSSVASIRASSRRPSPPLSQQTNLTTTPLIKPSD